MKSMKAEHDMMADDLLWSLYKLLTIDQDDDRVDCIAFTNQVEALKIYSRILICLEHIGQKAFEERKDRSTR